MGNPHAFSDLVGAYVPDDDKPKVVNAPAMGKCMLCGVESIGARLCPRHTCRGGYFLDEQNRWRPPVGKCGKPVHRWLAKSEPHQADEDDAVGPHDELGAFGGRPRQAAKSEWLYAGLCLDCGRIEREGRARLLKRADNEPEPVGGKKRREQY